MLTSLLLSGALLAAPIPDDAPAGVLRDAYPVGSYTSRTSLKAHRDGRLDTGAVVARLVAVDGRVPIALDEPAYSTETGLDLEFVHRDEGGWRIRGSVAANATRGRDTRLTAAVSLKVVNHGEEPMILRLAAELAPGPTDPEGRSWGALPFDPAERWSVDGQQVLRGSHPVARWNGTPATVELVDAGDGADAPRAQVLWSLELAPRSAQLVELLLAGPPLGSEVDDAAFATTLARRTYDRVYEDIRWQGESRGSFGTFLSADPRVRDAMVASPHQIRLMGTSVANQITHLSDSAYGHPLRDASLEPHMLGVLFEYGLGAIGVDHYRRLLDEAEERMADLPLDRKLSYVVGLGRCVRLAGDDADCQRLTGLVQGLLAEGWTEDSLEVDPWCHPDWVRQDLAAVVWRTGVDGDALVPRMLPAVCEEGSVDARFQQVVNALHDRRGELSWPILSELIDLASTRRLGGMVPGGDFDGRWAVLMGTVLRDQIIDDHGPELHLFAGANNTMLQVGLDIESNHMPTRFGVAKVQQYYMTRRLLGGWIRFNGPDWPERIVMHFPEGAGLIKPKGQPDGGEIAILDERTVDCVIGFQNTTGLRFQVKRESAAIKGR